MASAYKIGRLTNKEIDYITERADKQSPEEIAKHLKRRPAMVSHFIGSRKPLSAAGVEEFKVRTEFRKSPEWNYLKDEFTDDEIKFFEHRYARHMAQFKENIPASEETQVFLLIKMEILMHRNMTEKKLIDNRVNKAELAVGEMYRSCGNKIQTLSAEDRGLLKDTQSAIAALRSVLHASTKEYNELNDKHANLLKNLKAWREQRVNKIESTKQTFVELIKALEEQEIRDKESKELALMQLAIEKEQQRLAEPHTYADGVDDRPLLNAETVSDVLGN